MADTINKITSKNNTDFINFEKDLQLLINSYSIENDSNTPDFILSKMLINEINNINTLINHRDEWYNIKPGNNIILDNNYNINNINNNSIEGTLLIAAIAKITTESQTDKTPDEVLNQIIKLSNRISKQL